MPPRPETPEETSHLEYTDNYRVQIEVAIASINKDDDPNFVEPLSKTQMGYKWDDRALDILSNTKSEIDLGKRCL